MPERQNQLPPKRLPSRGLFGKSIFPHFDINVPMPAGTPIPPKVRVVSPGPTEREATRDEAKPHAENGGKISD